MLTPQPMVVLADVPAGSQWFQSVLGLTSAHGGDSYEMLTSGGTLVLQLHRWEAHEHPHLGDVNDPSRGNGILVWFATDDFDDALRRAAEHGAAILDGPLDNPNAGHREVWLRGPEGYVVVVAGPASS
jgi:predicted enzyme related to lactoylglutathione lyase